jgi:DNA-binding winged helix-turn-helix (wHTH) protein/Tol biopolymer transport system component
MYASSTIPAPVDTSETPNTFAFGEFVVDVGASKLLKGTAVVSLPSRTFDVLVYLIRHRERSVKKDEIIAAIWDNVIVTDDSLIHAISVLRRALGDEAHQHKYIETIPRRGYRFVGEISVDVPAAPEPVVTDSPVAPAAIAPELVAPRFARKAWMLLGAGTLAAIATSAMLLTDWQRAPAANSAFEASVHLVQTPPAGMTIVSGGVLSPDSRYLAFVARDDASGQAGLWVRGLYSGESRLIRGTDGASKPFWSPDSNRLGFFAHGKLFTTDLNGEHFKQIATSVAAAGATWGLDDTILFADWTSGLYAVAASGDGAVEPVLLLERESQDIAFAWPQFLPDGRFLFQITSLDPERGGAYVGNMETRTSFKILDTASSVTFAPPNYLLHVQRDMLIAEELDPTRLELTGHAIVVARDIPEPATAVENFVSASQHLLAFRRGVTPQNLSWFNRAGEQLESLATPAPLYNARLSPDGARLLASSSVTNDPGLWLTSVEREEFARIEKDATAPIWSPDGQRIAFTSRDGSHMTLRSSDGNGAPTLLMDDDQVKVLNDWSPDGRHIVYTRLSETTGLDLWIVDASTGASRPLLNTASGEAQARISPDGEWVAYTSDETGTLEVFVARFPGLEDKMKASAGGGGQPQWRADQNELFYFSPDQSIMALNVSDASGTLALGAPQPLFRTPIKGNLAEAREYYAADAAGAQFLLDTAAGAESSQEISIMVNWAARLADEGSSVAQASFPR